MTQGQLAVLQQRAEAAEQRLSGSRARGVTTQTFQAPPIEGRGSRIAARLRAEDRQAASQRRPRIGNIDFIDVPPGLADDESADDESTDDESADDESVDESDESDRTATPRASGPPRPDSDFQ